MLKYKTENARVNKGLCFMEIKTGNKINGLFDSMPLLE